MSDTEVATRLAERDRARKAALGDQPNPLDTLPPGRRAALTVPRNFLAPRTA